MTGGDSRGFGRDSPVELYQLHKQALDALLMVTACACVVADSMSWALSA